MWKECLPWSPFQAGVIRMAASAGAPRRRRKSRMKNGPEVRMFSADRLIYLVDCPSCGSLTGKSIAQLSTFEHLTCAAPGCGHLIDLNRSHNRAIIERL